MKIRPYNSDDYEGCRGVILRCLPDIGGLSESALRKLLKKAVTHDYSEEFEKSFCLILEENDSIFGMGILKGNEIKRMYIESAFRGNSYGKNLLNRLEGKAQELELEQLFIESSESAKGFYIHFGYAPIESYSYEIDGETISGLKMKKNITNR